MNPQDVCTALAESLADLGIRAYDYGPDAPHPPAAYVYPESIRYNASFSSDDADATFVVRLILDKANTQAGQVQMSSLVASSGEGSAVAAIQADNTLGGTVQSVEVTEARNWGMLTLPSSAATWLSVELVCDVFA